MLPTWLSVSRNAVLIAIVSRLVATSLAQAEVSDTAPNDGILASNTPQSPAATVGWKNDGVANQWTGVTFNVSNDVTLDRLTLAYSSIGRGVAGAKVSLVFVRLDRTDLSFSARIEEATVLQTDSFTLPSSMPPSGFLTFDIPDVAISASSAPYAFILSFDSQADYRSIEFVRANSQATGATVTVDGSNFAFRSHAGGEAYYSLTSGNLPQLYLQGATQ